VTAAAAPRTATRAAAAPRTAILAAMAEELHGLQRCLREPQALRLGGREFWRGRLGAHDVVLVRCGVGKVAAATTAALLIERFAPARLLFTGVAGGLHPQARVGDVVVADTLLQHDMDASPLFPRYEVPLYGRARFAADAALTDALQAAAQAALQHAGRRAASSLQHRPAAPSCDDAPDDELAHALHGLDAAHWQAFGVTAPRVHRGLVISGDRFVSRATDSDALRAALPDALAVEMEGAAVAQVCDDFALPFALLRTVSDRADDSAHVDFERFIADIASRYSVAVVLALLRALPLPDAAAACA
jgi:adenosylhomocysteine nucleosidase